MKAKPLSIERAYRGHLDIVKALLAHPGTNATIPDSAGWTPWATALSQGHIGIAFVSAPISLKRLLRESEQLRHS